MAIYQAIKKCKRYAESYERLAKRYEESDGWFYEQKAKQCRQDAADFYQMMHWLEELKELKGE